MKGMKFTMRPTREILARRGLETKGKVQQYVDNEVLRLSSPYVPHAHGDLEESGRLATEIGSGEVNWNTPYARYQYYGKLMVGEKTGSAWARSGEKKVVTSKNLTYQGGGLRGAKWFERMKLDHKEEIVCGAAEIAGGKPK